MTPNNPAAERVVERRRAVALARHYRETESLSIVQIADRLGRSQATIKAYFYDPIDANKGLSRELSGGMETDRRDSQLIEALATRTDPGITGIGAGTGPETRDRARLGNCEAPPTGMA